MDQLSFLENKSRLHQPISVVPVPFNIGSDNSDMDTAPRYLLKLGLKRNLVHAGFKIKVLPEVAASQKYFPSSQRSKKANISNTLAILAKVSKLVERELLENRKVLALGGDHTIAIGTIAGATKALGDDLGVVWIDAHGDMNTFKTSLSGNVHGMSSAVVLGIGEKKLTDLVKVKIKKENIIYIGLKDLDQAEIDLIRKQKLSVITMMEIVESGFKVVKERIDRLKKRTRGLWVSLDMDAVDEQFAPASAMANSGTLSYREITSIITYLGKTAEVMGMDIVELTPDKDVDNKTGYLSIELAAAAFGSKYNWYSRYMSAYEKST